MKRSSITYLRSQHQRFKRNLIFVARSRNWNWMLNVECDGRVVRMDVKIREAIGKIIVRTTRKQRFVPPFCFGRWRTLKAKP